FRAHRPQERTLQGVPIQKHRGRGQNNRHPRQGYSPQRSGGRKERMLYLFVALFLFFDAVLIHLLVCRKQSKQGELLLKLFFLIAGVNLAICWVMFYFLAKFTHGSSSIW